MWANCLCLADLFYFFRCFSRFFTEVFRQSTMLQLPQLAPQSKFNQLSVAINNGLQGFNIYQHQKVALVQMRDRFLDRTRPSIALCVLPTGTGKSGIAVLVPYVVNASKVLVITPSLTITQQLAKDYCGNVGDSFFEQRGIITAAMRQSVLEVPHCLTGGENPAVWTMHNLVIANAHKFGATAHVNLDEIPQDSFDLVIVDEAHHYPAPTWRRIVDHFPNSKRVFLTATPLHKGAPILANQNECLVFDFPRATAMDRGIIRRLEFEEVGNGLDGADARATAVVQRVLLKLNAQRNAHVAHGLVFQALILTKKKGDADMVANRANALQADIARPYHSGTIENRGNTMADNLARFKAGNLRILVVCGKLLEGFDHKNVSVVGILRNVALSSKVLFNQFVGKSFDVVCLVWFGEFMGGLNFRARCP